MSIGEKIMNMRKARGWSQEDLAGNIGVSRQAVSRWESDSAKPDADKIIMICDLFGVSADYLLRDVPLTTVSENVQQAPKKKRNRISVGQITGIALSSVSIVLLFVFVLVGATQGGTHDILYLDGTMKRYQGFMAFVTVNHLEWMLYVLGSLGVLGLVLLAWKPLTERFRVIYTKYRHE